MLHLLVLHFVLFLWAEYLTSLMHVVSHCEYLGDSRLCFLHFPFLFLVEVFFVSDVKGLAHG